MYIFGKEFLLYTSFKLFPPVLERTNAKHIRFQAWPYRLVVGSFKACLASLVSLFSIPSRPLNFSPAMLKAGSLSAWQVDDSREMAVVRWSQCQGPWIFFGGSLHSSSLPSFHHSPES